MMVTADGAVTLEKVGKPCAHRRGIKGKVAGTLVSFIGAEGILFMSVYIFKGKAKKSKNLTKNEGENILMEVDFSIPKQPAHNTRSSYPQYFAWTESGYSNTAIHHEIMLKFADLWMTREPSAYCFLFGDQLAAHKHVDTVSATFDRRVMSFLLPVNSSHFLQPLDDAAFATFKLKLNLSAFHVNDAFLFNPKDVQSLLNSLCYEAEQSAFTKRVIQRSFLNTGICPWDPDKIMKLAKENIGETEKDTKHKYVEAMARAVAFKERNQPKLDKIDSGRVRLKSNTLFSPQRILENYKEQEDTKLSATEAKEAAKKEKQDAADVKRASRTCSVDDCIKMTRKEGGAKNWSFCEFCEILFCPNHKNEYKKHSFEHETYEAAEEV